MKYVHVFVLFFKLFLDFYFIDIFNFLFFVSAQHILNIMFV